MTEVVNATLSMLKTLKAQPLRALKSPAECPMGFMRPGCRLNRVSRAFEIKREKGALKKCLRMLDTTDLTWGSVISKRVRKRVFKIAVAPPRKI